MLFESYRGRTVSIVIDTRADVCDQLFFTAVRLQPSAAPAHAGGMVASVVPNVPVILVLKGAD
jgi:hypothetical protein